MAPNRTAREGKSATTTAESEKAAWEDWQVPAAKNVPDDQLREQIELVAKRTPRYLFRAWSAASGGNAALNTPEAITPLAFHNGRRHLSIHDYPRGELTDLAFGHYNQQPVETPFSSWSGSLAFAIAFARGHQDASISIIDTKQLSVHNIILHTPVMSFIFPVGSAHESLAFGGFHAFLAFGIIAGSAHVAIPLQTILENGLTALHEKGPVYETNDRSASSRLRRTGERDVVGRQLATCQSVGRCFGDQFALPITVYLIFLREHREPSVHKQIVETLGSFAVPDEWAGDRTIMSEAAVTGQLNDTQRAIGFMRMLVHRKLRGNANTAAGSVEPRVQSIGPGEGDTPAAPEKELKRYHRMVRELYIDLTGCKNPELLE